LGSTEARVRVPAQEQAPVLAVVQEPVQVWARALVRAPDPD
jgi:hypothetical protein